MCEGCYLYMNTKLLQTIITYMITHELSYCFAHTVTVCQDNISPIVLKKRTEHSFATVNVKFALPNTRCCPCFALSLQTTYNNRHTSLNPRVEDSHDLTHVTSGYKRYTFETSHQVLTSIYRTRLTPCCLLLYVYYSMLPIVESLKWGMHVRCEHQCVSDLGLL